MKISLLAGVALVAVSAGGAFAADLPSSTPAPVAVAPAPAADSSVRGLVEVGALYSNVNQPAFNGSVGGGYLDANIWGGANDAFMWGIDGTGEYNGFSNTGTQAPKYLGVIGAHLGYGLGSGSEIGAFGSLGSTPNAADNAQGGYTAGVEGIWDMDPARLFGQVGYANTQTNGTAGFTGWFAHGGAAFSLTNDFAVMADVGYGYAPDNFGVAATGHNGSFTTAGVKVAYKLPTDFAAFVTAGYEYGYYNDQANNTNATSQTVKVGLAIPFGSDTTAVDALNPLGTYAAPYRAASFSSTLR
jgi:hypothetical protein